MKAATIPFSSSKEQAIYLIEETRKTHKNYLEKTNGSKPKLFRLFIVDTIGKENRPDCYQVKFDQETQQPILHSRPHVEFKKAA